MIFDVWTDGHKKEKRTRIREEESRRGKEKVHHGLLFGMKKRKNS